MADNGSFYIDAGTDGRFRGSSPDGTTPQSNANSLAIGTLVANPTTGNGAWPMADLVKMSDAWTDNGGTGSYTITPEEHVTIDGTAELTRVICYDFLQTFPRVGTYTVTKTGTAEVQILAGGVSSGWQSASSFTFTAAPSQSISAYVRSGDGSSATLTQLSIVHQDDLAAFQADSDALSLGWVSHIRDDMQSPIIRNLLPHEAYEDEFSNRTTPQSLSYANTRDRSTNLSNEAGTKVSTFSLEVQASMVNQLGADTFCWNIPPHATDDWVLQASQLIQSTLNPNIRVAIALTNESWNSAFWYNAQVIRTSQIAKTTFSTVPGSNTWTSTAHGFSNGDILASIVSPNSARLAVSGPYHASGLPWPAPVLTRIQVTNATANTIDLVLQSDGTTPFNAPAGVTEVYGWLESAFDLDGTNFDTQVDNAHGIRSSQIFDIAVPVFSAGGRETVRLIESQSDFISRTLERTGVNGANGNYDAISLGLYYNAADVWEVGDTEAEMEADGLVAAEAVIQAAVVGHINAGFLPENIWSYEAGPHWIAELGSNGTLQQRQDAFVAFASTQGMANTEEYFYNRCQELGLRNMVITSPDLYVFGTSGTWGSKSELYLPDIPRTTLYKSWEGYIEPQVADVTAPSIALNGNATVNVVTGGTYTDEGATWNDNVDGTGQVFADMTGVDFSTPNTYTITYSYTDVAGNGPATVTRDIVVANAASITDNEYWVAGHSLFNYTGGSPAPNTDYTLGGQWLGLIAGHNSVESSGGYTFGQVTNINAYDWSSLANVPLIGTFPLGNTRPFDPSDTQLVGKNLDRYFFMPSNFLEADVGGPPFDGDEATFQGVTEQLITNVSQYWPNAEKIMFIHCPDGGHYTTNDDMTPTQFTSFINDALGDYLDWFIAVQDLVNSNNTYDIKSFPVYPVILWIIQNESYLSSTVFSDYFGDSAPHGTETMYFLIGLVLYRCIYQANPVMTGFTFPAGTNVISAVQNNLSAIVSAIETRLAFHNSNGVNVY